MRKLMMFIMALLLLTLACSLPSLAPAPNPTQTPIVYVTVLVATPTADPEAASSTTTPSPLPLPPPPTQTLSATATLSVTATPTGTVTITPTATPDGPTATPTLATMGDPLAFDDPSWELVVWHEVPDTNDWEGTIRLHVLGGVAPYRFQIEEGEISNSNELLVRWRICQPMPATARVWSADGQLAHTSVWVWELGCKD